MQVQLKAIFRSNYKVSWWVDFNKKNEKKIAFEIEKTEINILQKNMVKLAFLLFKI